jgi:hypothetical protein
VGNIQLGGSTRLVVDTTHVETVTALEESVTLDGDRGNSVTLLNRGSSLDEAGAQSKGSSQRDKAGLHF